ncbi:protein DpdG [Priestia megaterium]|uniref:protein DpdG n=1 Tax=Priestia megaterium TaxID=1404 RepID=UPI002DB73A05|nr:protein DpdG [Priestia megaterium]MEC1071410.1 protein DpdG [Priestia megaterium]
MSVLKKAYATPSRVRAVYRFLLHSDKSKIKREDLEKSISPLSIQRENDKDYLDMVKETIKEMIRMKLIDEDAEGNVFLGKDLPKEIKDKNIGNENLPFYISKLFFTKENDENHDFVRLATWYLSQNFQHAPSNWEEFSKQLDEQIGSHKLECGNNTRYGQLEDWLLFCRFAIKYSVKGVGTRMVPDPTLYIQWLLPQLFHDEKTLTIVTLIDRLSNIAPIFDHGTFRKELFHKYKVGKLTENYISTVTSNALLRLHEVGLIKLERKADADTMIIYDGSSEMRYTHVSYQDGRE